MRDYVALYVPRSLMQHDPTILSKVVLAFTRIAGGATSYDAHGFWIDNKVGDVVQDEVVIIKSYCTPDRAVLLQYEAQAWARTFKDMGQSAVAIETQAGLEIV